MINMSMTLLRIKPLTLASGHGRYIAVTPERTLVSVGEWPLHINVKFITVLLPKRLRNSRFGFRSKTATWIQELFKNLLGLLGTIK
jgi:hypothetical protein